MPDEGDGGRRRALAWKLIAAFAAGALVAGIAVALLVGKGTSTTPKPKVGNSSSIEMADATGASCRPPVAPGPGHPTALLSQLFNVQAGAATYLLGWQILPYSGVGRTYRFGPPSGNLLALEPPTGGTPVGYGTGTVTFGSNAQEGTIDAVVKLKSGKSLTVGGAWRCTVAASSTTTLPALPAG